MPDGPPPLTLPELPPDIARPSRRPAPVDVVRRRWVVVALALLHVIGVVLVDDAMQLQMQLAPRYATPEEAIEIVFLDRPESLQVLPAGAVSPVPAPSIRSAPSPAVAERAGPPPASTQPQAPPRPQSQAELLVEPRQPPAAALAVPTEPPPLDTLKLFNDDGSPRLSREAIDATQPVVTVPEFAAPKPQAIAPIRLPVPYRSTRFEESWAPPNETLGGATLRRVTVEKEFKTRWGTTWRCAWILIIGGCGDVPPPAMKNPPKAPWETYQTEPETPRAVDFRP